MNPSKVAMAGKIQPNGSYLKGIEDFIPSSQYNCDKHHLKVVEDIKENWVTLSLNSKFHALLATESIPEAIAYYRLLRKEMPTLKVTALFDPNIDNTGGQTFKEEGLIEVLEGYKEQFGKLTLCRPMLRSSRMLHCALPIRNLIMERTLQKTSK